MSVTFLSAILGPEMAAPQFYGRLEKCVLSAGKTMSIKFLVLGEGYFGFGGGKCRFYFYGREDFSDQNIQTIVPLLWHPGNLLQDGH